VSEDTRKSSEFRGYRRGLTTAYLVIASCGGILLTASVIKSLLHKPAVALTGPKLSADNPNAAELVQCNRDVARLLSSLGREAAAIIAEPNPEIDRRWEEFSRHWRIDYDEVNARCQFSELAQTTLGTAYDRMAEVYSDLPAMRLKYKGMIVRFDEEQSDELEQMHRALELSLAALDKRSQRATTE
jgi:hypothetical protein